MRSIFLALGAAMGLTACAGAPWQELKPEEKTIRREGFTLHLEDAARWYRYTPAEPRLLMAKTRGNGNDPYENYTIEVSVPTGPAFPSDEAFLRGVRQGTSMYSDPAYKVIKDELRLVKKDGRNCALDFITAEALKELPSRGVGIHHRFGNMLVDYARISCREKSNPTRIVDLSYSLSYYPKEGDPAFLSEALNLLDGLILE